LGMSGDEECEGEIHAEAIEDNGCADTDICQEEAEGYGWD